ncbi:MAG: hypothetical protein ACNI3H_12055 [Halarcobacter ebronensis]
MKDIKDLDLQEKQVLISHMKRKVVNAKCLATSSSEDKDKEDNAYKATVSYGQGMTSTFMQIMKAFTQFLTMDGNTITPRIVSHLEMD